MYVCKFKRIKYVCMQIEMNSKKLYMHVLRGLCSSLSLRVCVSVYFITVLLVLKFSHTSKLSSSLPGANTLKLEACGRHINSKDKY